MITKILARGALIGAGLYGLAAVAEPAAAGQCPADQIKDGARSGGATAPVGVTDTELDAVDLGPEIDGLDGRRLRMRKLTVEPGGVVPWHDHTDRPALIMTAEGEITEYRSDCAVGIVHKAGDVSKESGGVKHWWKNESDAPAVLYAADIKNDN